MSALLVMVGLLGVQFETGISGMANSMNGTIQLGNMIDMVVPDNKTYEMVGYDDFLNIITNSRIDGYYVGKIHFTDQKNARKRRNHN